MREVIRLTTEEFVINALETNTRTLGDLLAADDKDQFIISYTTYDTVLAKYAKAVARDWANKKFEERQP